MAEPRLLTIFRENSYHRLLAARPAFAAAYLISLGDSFMASKTENNPRSQFELPFDRVAVIQRSPSESVERIDTAVSQALQTPIQFPPLGQAVIPDDRVAIPVQIGMPFAAEILMAVVNELVASGLDPENITIVLPNHSELVERVKSEPALFERVRITVHDPANPDELAYLIADSTSEPIKVNRTLFDAEMVLPVGWTQTGMHRAENFFGVPRCFLDQATQDRILAHRNAKYTAEVFDAVNDNLGAFTTVQIVDSPGGRLHRVLFGERQQVGETALQIAAEAWSVSEDRLDSDLVVASLEGDSIHQTWDSFVDAILFSDSVSRSNSTIVVFTNLKSRPPKWVEQALDASQPLKPKKSDPRQQHLNEAVSRRRVFLKSGLSRSVTEELGMGYLTTSDEMDRLIAQASDPVLIQDAHRCFLQSSSTSKNS